mmetsp:Transcript_25228/g.64088  ORF Transcript_25228/g.64088 Transcript_25228/m.64088 type:complete len:164 (+) Transcript_25228:901-1392(+)
MQATAAGMLAAAEEAEQGRLTVGEAEAEAANLADLARSGKRVSSAAQDAASGVVSKKARKGDKAGAGSKEQEAGASGGTSIQEATDAAEAAAAAPAAPPTAATHQARHALARASSARSRCWFCSTTCRQQLPRDQPSPLQKLACWHTARMSSSTPSSARAWWL